MLKIDLGSGGCKQEGFTGVDRFPLENVDVVADLDGRLPFDSDSVDLVYASHSLEHVRDLMATMREVYRICKHGAQICIVAPYNEQKLNLANPYHICVFNEHTPRFWTDYPDAFIDPEEYAHPHAPNWGLSRSDHSNPGLDLRLVRMEFFYFPEYRYLSIEEQRALRRERLDVCDQIMYHLIVWKGDEHSPARTFADHVADFQPFEPNYVKQRKEIEQEELIQVIVEQRDQARAQIAELQSQLAQKEQLLMAASTNTRRVLELEKDIDRAESLATDLRSESHQMRMQLAGAFEKIEVLNDQLQATKIVLAKSQAENVVLTEATSSLGQENAVLKNQVATLADNLHSAQGDLAKVHSDGIDTVNSLQSIMQENQNLRAQLENIEVLKGRTSLLKVELETANGLLAWHQSLEESRNAELSRIKEELAALQLFRHHWEQGKSVVGELHAQATLSRTSRMARLASFLTSKDQLWESVSPAFSEIKSYTAQHFQKSSRARFVLGDDLSSIPYREYAIPFKMHSLNKVSLAIRPLLPTSQGTVGIEIVSSAQRVVAHLSLPLSDIRPDAPTDFIMPTHPVDLGEPWSLRVFVRNVDVPVAIYELVKYSAFSRRINYIPFVFLQ
jgi:SAM-dependent methyltransferase